MAKVTFKGVQGPGGMVVPKETLLHLATAIPVLRAEIIATLQAQGYLEAAGLRKVSWWSRMWAHREKALPATAG